MINFFSKEDERQIIAAIQQAETKTSGEVRVHLARKVGNDVMASARQTFARLDMHKTEARNGVLFFLAPKQHKFAILGDEGINAVVPPHFWDDVRDLAQAHFRRGEFAAGICRALERIGEKLQEHFPYQDDDINELPDDISYD